MRDGEEIADRERHERARRKILLRSWSENRFFDFGRLGGMKHEICMSAW